MGQIYSYEDDQIRLPACIPSYDNQSRAVKGEVATRVSHFNDDGELLRTSDPAVTTLYESFTKGLQIAGADGNCLGYRPAADAAYKWLTYGYVHKATKAFGCGLRKFGLQPGEKTFVGFYAQNRPEWVIASLGSVSQGMVIVPLYDTLGTEAVQFILNQTDIRVVVCDTAKHARVILDSPQRFPNVRHIVLMDKVEGEIAEPNEQITVHGFYDVIKIGEQNPVEPSFPNSDDLYMLCYTSGTTGTPKGVMLTHGNLVAFAGSLSVMFKQFGIERWFTPGKSTISYLPLAHSFEQLIHATVFKYGMQIGFYRGNVTTLLDDCKVLKPAVFPVVPRLLNKLYDKVQMNLAKARTISRWLFHRAYDYKLGLLKQGIITQNTWWDRLIFRKIQEELGGCVQFMATGAAPISEEVLTMCRVALGCVLVEGYGQTESAAACTVTLPGDAEPGNVGAPVACVKVKLIDIPEMNYWAKDNKGEICVKGHAVMKGYYKEEGKTVEAIDDDGWLYTGDVGTWLPNGTLQIIDRKKHIFKLAQGEYVAPEKIENIFMLMPLISQIFVDGNSLQRFLVAVVVPDEHATRAWFRGKNEGDTANRPMNELCQDTQFKEALLAQIEAHGKAHKLNGIERPKNIHLSADAFTVENDLLTPTFKAKRPQLRERFAKHIEHLYQETNSASDIKAVANGKA